MKAAFLTGLRRMELRDAPEPKLVGPDDVLIAIAIVGVCGSDMHYYRAGRIGCQLVQYPWIAGHECAGAVQAVGPAVRSLRPGQRIAVDPLIWCHKCDQCRAGDIHTCRDQSFLGCPGQLAGSLSQRLVMPEASCFPVPDSMTMARAALVEPLSIALWASRLGNVQPGMKVGILGAGPIGLSVLSCVKHAAACTVYQTDLLDNRLALARRMGADWTGNAAGEDIEAVIAAAEPLGLDVVFECVGDEKTINQCLRLVKPRGLVVLVGIPEEDSVPFEMNQMRRKEIRVQNVRRQRHCVQPAIDLLASGELNLDGLVTHEFALDQVAEAFELVADYRDGVVKAMIRVAEE